jgi:nitroreductase
METWDAIRARRNVRVFAERAVADADLDRILEAGRRAPSSRNWQPWDFVLVTDREQLPELAKVWRGAAHVAGAAAAIVCLGPVLAEDDHRHNWLHYDHGQATMSMALEATDLGIGSSHAAVADQDLARSLLGFPEDRFAVSLLSLGYPADRPLVPLMRPDRRPFDEVVHRGRW